MVANLTESIRIRARLTSAFGLKRHPDQPGRASSRPAGHGRGAVPAAIPELTLLLQILCDPQPRPGGRDFGAVVHGLICSHDSALALQFSKLASAILSGTAATSVRKNNNKDDAHNNLGTCAGFVVQ